MGIFSCLNVAGISGELYGGNNNMEENDEWEYCRFKEGDIVRFTREWKGTIGTITGIFQTVPYDCVMYYVTIEGDNKKDSLIVDEDNLEEADLSYIETGSEISLTKPVFRVGDVVAVDDQNELRVVSEVVILNTGETVKYLYEVSFFYSEGEACTYEEEILKNRKGILCIRTNLISGTR